MRRMFGLFIGLIVVLAGMVACNSMPQPVQAPQPQSLRVATLNVHYIWLGSETGAWSVGDWERRKGPLQSAFEAIDADVIGFQEMESFAFGAGEDVNLTLDWLRDQNPDYAAAAIGDPAEFPWTQPILYRSERLSLRDQGWFFFSDTPDVIYSRTFNGSWPAYTSWAEFEDRQDGQIFRVYNIHTEYRSASNRRLSTQLVAERITEPASRMPVFVIGDFNALKGSATLRFLEDVGVTFWPVQGSTYHLNSGINLFPAIDLRSERRFRSAVDLMGNGRLITIRLLGISPSTRSRSAS